MNNNISYEELINCQNYAERVLNFYKLCNKGKLPLSSLLTNIKLYAARFEDDYTLSQSIFNPYPETLIDISDSGKGRSL